MVNLCPNKALKDSVCMYPASKRVHDILSLLRFSFNDDFYWSLAREAFAFEVNVVPRPAGKKILKQPLYRQVRILK
jgi:hypothetical protein